MKYILEIFKEYVNSKGCENLFNYSSLPEGDYFKINNNGEILSHLCYNKKKTDEIAFSEDINYFKQRWFFDRRLTSNKSIEIKKKFESVSPYLIAMNEKNIKEMDKYLKSYLTNLNKKFNANIDVDSLENLYLSVLQKVVGKMSSKKIFIVLDVDIELQKKAYYRYLDESLFLTKPIEIDGIIKGTPVVGYTLNKDKPNILSVQYRKNNYLLSKEQAILLVYISKINDMLNELLKDSNRNIEFYYNPKDNEIITYSKSMKKKNLLYKEYNILSEEMPNLNTIDSEKNREDLLKIIDSLTDYKISKVIDCKDVKNLKLQDELFKYIALYKDILKEYFKREKQVDIAKIIEKAFLIKLIEVESDISKANKNEITFDKMISVINTLNANKEEWRYQDINMSINKYIEKINNIDENVISYEIENDKEFLFTSGQVLRYLLNQSESVKKNNLNEVSSLKTVYNIKKKTMELFYKYKYKCNSRKLELLIQAILAYEIDEVDINIQGNMFYYHGGIIGTNYIYGKSNK